MQNRSNNKAHRDKKEITLLTLLANESTKDANKILVKHGKKPASNFQELESKLADLYFNSPDKKLELEKEFAEIHPHKKWLLKYIEPKIVEEKSKADGPKAIETKQAVNCDCEKCPSCSSPKMKATEDFIKSSAEGSNSNESNLANKIFHTNQQTLYVTLGVVAIIAIFGMTLHHKKQ